MSNNSLFNTLNTHIFIPKAWLDDTS